MGDSLSGSLANFVTLALAYLAREISIAPGDPPKLELPSIDRAAPRQVSHFTR